MQIKENQKYVSLYHLTAVMMFIFITSRITYGQIPAFPGAEGFGTNTIGGRGGKVIKVTNLNDHGPGSLREAIEMKEPRIIIFEVGGIINLETKLSIHHPFLTIAGQTAPGNGICIRGEGIHVYTHDVILRNLRIRPGDIDFGPPNAWDEVDGISISGGASCYNIIIDHCSLSWAVDENIGIWNEAHDITIQNCIISEALNRSRHPKGNHGMGMLIGSKASKISIHHNLFAHNNDRNPHINGKSIVDFRNNVIYNAGGVASDIQVVKGQAINYINNYILKGPRTKIPAEVIIRNLKNSEGQIFIKGNIGIRKRSSNEDNWLMTFDTDHNHIPSRNIQIDQPFPSPIVTTHTAEQALNYVLENAGAILPRRDAVDRKVISDVQKQGDGMANNKNYLLAWPPLDAGVPYADTDNDGMPDHWEERYGLNIHFDDTNEDPDNDGYTNIEEYLNTTDPVSLRNNQMFGADPLSSNSKRNSSYPQLNFAIEQNYPNPFSESTNITFTLDRSSNVTLKVINVDGSEVFELIDGFLYEGKYHILWDSSQINPGIYQIYLTSDHEVKTVKAIISR